MTSHLENALNEKIEFRYEKKYDDIIEQFATNNIDIAYFGPLPFSVLYKKFPSALPIVTFHDSDGKSSYRCALVKFAKDTIDFKSEIPPKVALTQPLSTCGYTRTKVLIKDHFNQDLSKMLYRYVGKHDEAALSVIRGDFLLAGIKESVALEHKSLGLEIVSVSALLPGFTLVVNTKTLSAKQIETIKKTLLSTPKEVYETWGKDISYGMSETDISLFDALMVNLQEFNVPQSGNFK